MFDLMIFVLINAFWFTLIIGATTLFILRTIYAYQSNYSLNEKLQIVFMPLSLGFYKYNQNKNMFSLFYRILVVLFFITGFIAFIYIVYTELELMLL